MTHCVRKSICDSPLNQPEIKVKIEETIRESFKTYTAIIQGDCLSAILFMLYFAKLFIKPIKTNMKYFLITPKYADDITYVGISK